MKKATKVDPHKKAAELSEKLKCSVKFVRIQSDILDEGAIAYFRPANSYTKMQCIDIMMQSAMKAGATLFDATVIKEESDPRVFQKDNDDDVYHIGAITFCVQLLQGAGGILKKNK